jgi:hypothetical protein
MVLLSRSFHKNLGFAQRIENLPGKRFMREPPKVRLADQYFATYVLPIEWQEERDRICKPSTPCG